MEQTPDTPDKLSTSAVPSEEEAAGAQADPVQGYELDQPTGAELEADDGYHPEVGGEKYADPDPVDEELLARQEGLGEDDETLLEQGETEPEQAL
jgi:hypothetical protein